MSKQTNSSSGVWVESKKLLVALDLAEASEKKYYQTRQLNDLTKYLREYLKPSLWERITGNLDSTKQYYTDRVLEHSLECIAPDWFANYVRERDDWDNWDSPFWGLSWKIDPIHKCGDMPRYAQLRGAAYAAKQVFLSVEDVSILRPHICTH